MTCNCKNVNHAGKVKMCREMSDKPRVVKSNSEVRSLSLLDGKQWQIGDEYSITRVCAVSK